MTPDASPDASPASPIDSSGDSSGGISGDSAGDTDVLDLRGEQCPYTFVRTRLRLEQMPLGATLHVLVDHEPATRNIPRSARDWGQAVDAVAPEGPGLWRITMRKQVD